MKRMAVWVLYGIGALAILYLALSAYAAFTGHGLQPGDPIHIFRGPTHRIIRDGPALPDVVYPPPARGRGRKDHAVAETR
jgi:hypothetical protein